MPVRVIVPPAPIMTATDVIGSADASVDAMIDAVTSEIDGPDGWLGRCIGPQTLEKTLDCWERRIYLPCAPIIDIVSINYTDTNGNPQTLDTSVYDATGELLWFSSTWSPPALGCVPDPIRIQYRAGYNGTSVSDGGTGDIPSRITQAVKLSVQHLRAIGGDDLFLQIDVVEGIGRKQYAVSEVAGNIIRDAADRLLSGLRRYA